MRRITFCFFIFLIALSASNKGIAVDVLKGKEVFLFSEVSGLLTYKGVPASRANVRRLVKIGDKSYEEVIEANDEGLFHFDSLKKVERAIFPKEFVSHQKLIVEYENKEFLIWEGAKRSEERNAELDGKPLIFKCELTDDTRFFHMMFHSIGTSCTWES